MPTNWLIKFKPYYKVVIRNWEWFSVKRPDKEYKYIENSIFCSLALTIKRAYKYLPDSFYYFLFCYYWHHNQPETKYNH